MELAVQEASEVLCGVHAVEVAAGVGTVVCGVGLVYFLVLVWAGSVVEVSTLISVDVPGVTFVFDRIAVTIVCYEVEVARKDSEGAVCGGRVLRDGAG